MWDDIVVGKGEKLNSAILVSGILGNKTISHNRSAFWITGCVLGFGMTIYKHTVEGKKLSALISAGTPYSEIQDWLNKVALKRVPVKKLQEEITKALSEAFNEGRAHKAREIRQALYIRG